MTIDIIGAGIGGLSTAIALEEKGMKPRIFEQAEQLMPVGAGIILAINAMQVYQKLGLREQIEHHGNYCSAMNITRPNLQPLSKIDFTSWEQKFNVKTIAIHRGQLQQLLLDELKSSELHLNHKLSSIISRESGASLEFQNGSSIKSSLVIGADGLHSILRKSLFPKNGIRTTNQICWRGIATFDLPNTYQNQLFEAWGKSERFGFVPTGENKVYWYAVKSFDKSPDEHSVTLLERYYNNYHPIIQELIKSTNQEQIHTSEISDVKPAKTWYQNSICLLGDAAHAMTPNMGQGACQAIEDAFVLAQCLSTHKVNKAFENYQKLRQRKANQMVNMSRRIGKLSHVKNPILSRLRNIALTLTPSRLTSLQLEKLFNIEYKD